MFFSTCVEDSKAERPPRSALRFSLDGFRFAERRPFVIAVARPHKVFSSR